MSARAPETLQRLKNTDWEILLDRINDKKCTPILGTGTRSEVLTLRSKIASEWAIKYGYPRLEGAVNLARVSRFISIQYDSDFTKRRLVEQLQTIPEPNLDDPNNPYSILASLPLPVYITTDYDDFMFQALIKANRDAKRELCRWNGLITASPSIFAEGFNPSVANPVVFHFHGLTEDLDSLVLTEDDYFEFLINVSKDRELIPPRIEKAMTGTSLLLLGYRLDDWDFRVMFHMLASYLERSTTRTHVAVQIAPVEDQAPEEQKRKAQDYLDLYFEKYKKLDIRIYWGSCQEFMEELNTRWKGHANP
jgi:SIR2-like domain